ncbi:hypothetical protein, partial [Acidithiobacillus sp.]|uniref:hypothetical protein n=1 Tax=Acidithiobacillus sp. TaxID=1872118 RepID=UPI0025B90D53
MAKGVGFWCLDSRKPTRSLVLSGFAIGGDLFFNKKATNPILGAAFKSNHPHLSPTASSKLRGIRSATICQISLQA